MKLQLPNCEKDTWVTVLGDGEIIGDEVWTIGYYEIYSYFKNNMKSEWRKVSKRRSRWFQYWLEEARKVLKILL